MEEEVAQYLQKYDNSYLINKGVGLFDNVDYFSETYSGKMFITPQAIYYFPLWRSHEIEENEDEENLFSFVFWELLFLVGLIAVSIYFYEFYQKNLVSLIAVLLPILFSLWKLISKLTSRFFNRHNQKENAISNPYSFLSIDQLHKELDEYIKTRKLETAYFDENSVPHPIKFDKNKICDLSINSKRSFLSLHFRTKYDEHDFVFQSQPRSLILDSLVQNGFLNSDQS